ncbi:MAG: type II toxin-antitoxin system RelE/ParE family toxin [Planctomycetaceae bacterium]|nr:type II toxin-antitoxin system RelE/ParE family toxin [Planctomycetaceae bacterium]
MIRVRFHRLAARELRAAHGWYQRRDRAAAARFLIAVDSATARIRIDPDSLPFERRHCRSIRVQRYPYRLVFERLEPGFILIIAVAHTSRRPGYWSRRNS